MTIRNVPDDRTPLPDRIARVERQLLERRRRIGTVVVGIRQKVRARLISPGLLLAAGLGVALEQSTHRKGLRLVTLLGVASTGSRLLTTLSVWTKRSPAPPKGRALDAARQGPLVAP